MSSESGGGVLAWFAGHSVVANLLMIVFLFGGLLTIPRIKKEVFPRATLDVVTVTVPYPGASPREVEKGVLRAVEEEVRALEGVKEVRSVAAEGQGVVHVELLLGTDRNEMLSEVESAVGRITSFPEDAEEPTISLVSNRRQVISLVYSGDHPERVLQMWAERAREDLLARPDITFVQVSGVRPHEISIEISPQVLRRFGLTLRDVAARVTSASVDLPAGEIEARDGEIALRTTEREEDARQFARVPLVAGPGGSEVLLGDVARVRDGYRDVDRATFFNQEPAVRVDVFRVGDEEPLEVSRAVQDFAREQRAELPPSVRIATWNDQSQIYADRMSLLLKNAYLGLAIVLIILALLLEPRLAFWVTLGIPISFLGAALLLPSVDVSINLISLFAFIVALGLVVDDAIVVGEAIYRRRQESKSYAEAAIAGVRDVAQPVLFSIATTCIAFTPMLFVPGVAGQFFRNIPLVVILVLAVSLVESLLILPAHLSHPMPRALEVILTPFIWLMKKARSDRVSEKLEEFVDRRYVPAVRAATKWRYVTLAVAVFALLLVVGLQAGGRLGFRFLPDIQDDQIRASVELPVGTPFSKTLEIQRQVVEAAQRAVPDDDAGILQGVLSDVGIISARDQPSALVPRMGSHLAYVTADLVAAGKRTLTSKGFVERWRRELESLPETASVKFAYNAGATTGAPINLRLGHPDQSTLEEAAQRVAAGLGEYENTIDVDDGVTRGKERIDFQLTERGRAQGFTEADLARELRGFFFGAEVQRFQRGRHEVRVYVRLDEPDRDSLEDLERLTLRAPGGGEMPLGEVAELRWGHAFTRIERTDLRRTVNVTAYLQGEVTPGKIVAHFEDNRLREIRKEYPELSVDAGGQQQSQAEAVSSLASGFAVAAIVMYGLLAIAFQSYVQPFIVLAAIPFGFVGAVFGHLAMGFNLSLSSLFGLVALSGVVVNDSLLLVDSINRESSRTKSEGSSSHPESLIDAAISGGALRFRPVLITSLTTFGGLSPMMFETGVQAQFLVPMALSLGFGILFAPLVLVFIVPSLYLALEDVRRLLRRFFSTDDDEQEVVPG